MFSLLSLFFLGFLDLHSLQQRSDCRSRALLRLFKRDRRRFHAALMLRGLLASLKPIDSAVQFSRKPSSMAYQVLHPIGVSHTQSEEPKSDLSIAIIGGIQRPAPKFDVQHFFPRSRLVVIGCARHAPRVYCLPFHLLSTGAAVPPRNRSP
jgi:hypothetical protein